MSRACALLYGSRRPLDQFAGVPDLLRSRGMDVLYERLWDREIRVGLHASPDVIGRAGVVAFADLSWNMHLRPTRIARRLGKPTVLLVDGVVEFANIFLNPWLGPDHLCPAPQDIVLALGPLQARLLAEMGNDPIVTGLPRLDGFGSSVEAERRGDGFGGWLVVATANTPALSEPARLRVCRALSEIRDAAARRGIEVRWRLDAGMAATIGVVPDTASLASTIAGARGVLTTASTLAVESMIAGVPTGIFHPHPWPLWVPAAWVWQPSYPETNADAGEVDAAKSRTGQIRSVAEAELARLSAGTDPVVAAGSHQTAAQAGIFVDEVINADRVRMEAQTGLLHSTWKGESAHAVAEVIGLAALDGHVHGSGRAPIPTVARSYGTVRSKRGPRVVSLIMCGTSPVGGVTNWSVRMGRAFASDPRLGMEFHTVAVGTEPLNFAQSNVPEFGADACLHACVLDPTAGTHERIRVLTDYVRALEPDILIPNYDDESFAVAAAMHARGTRCLAIAHVEEPGITRTFTEFDCWEACVGVSRACVEQLRPAACGRPITQIVYGVPVASVPRHVSPNGPIRLAYLGRMVENQKRISDLIVMIGHLERLGVDYRFDAVGDGPDARGWTERVRSMGLLDRRVFVHGRRSMEWVEAFLPTIDCSVLLSGWEGTSIAMLEAMGAGVVPCVSEVSSGVGEWVGDGVHGVVVPVGRADLMAERIAGLADNRPEIARLSVAAHARMVERRMGVADMAVRYADVFDALMRRERRPLPPSDLAVRLADRSVWTPRMPDDDADADAWVVRGLKEGGYTRIAVGEPGAACDAVLIPTRHPRPEPETVDAWRAAGLGVGIAPNLCVERCVLLAQRAVDRLRSKGCDRIAIFGAGTQSAAFGPVIRAGAPIVGWIDDAAPPGSSHLGLPVCRSHEALLALALDGVVLNTDRYEPLLALRCGSFHGVRTAAVFRDENVLEACVGVLRAACALSARGGRVLVVCGPDTVGYADAIGADKSIGVLQLAERVRSEDAPDLVVFAFSGPEEALWDAVRPWTDRGVRVASCLRASPGDAPVNQVDRFGRETSQAEPITAPA